MHDDLRVAEPDRRPRGIHPYHAPEGCSEGQWVEGWMGFWEVFKGIAGVVSVLLIKHSYQC